VPDVTVSPESSPPLTPSAPRRRRATAAAPDRAQEQLALGDAPHATGAKHRGAATVPVAKHPDIDPLHPASVLEAHPEFLADVEADADAALLPDDATIAAIIKESEQAIRERPSGSSSSFLMYLHDLQRYPVLTAPQEHRLAALARQGSEEARDALVRHNLRFVITIARKSLSHGVAIEDLVQEGNFGLMRAVTKFDPTRGVKFVSYAVYWIQQAIRAGLAAQQRSVRLPISRASQLAKINRTQAHLQSALKRQPSPAEIAAVADIPLGMVETLMSVAQGELSFDAPHPASADEGGSALAERVGGESSSGIEIRMEQADRNRIVQAALGGLRERDAVVLRLAYGIDGGRDHTLEEVGLVLKITRERVRQIRDRALRDLRAQGLAPVLKEYWGVDFPE
jgi:RNA polymerase primary sigma factor